MCSHTATAAFVPATWKDPGFLPTLELRQLHADLIYCYKILFGLIDVLDDNFFEYAPLSVSRGHNFKLYKEHSTATDRAKFFRE